MNKTRKEVISKGLIWFIALTSLLFSGALFFTTAQQTAANTTASCASGATSGYITTPTTWDGEVYIDNFVIVRNTTLTITAGSEIIVCGDHLIKIGDLWDPGRLIAIGTADNPITIRSESESIHWNTLYFEDGASTEPSIMRHVIIDNAGSTIERAGITISGRHSYGEIFPGIRSPIIDNVTIQDSLGYGIDIGMDTTGDPTPPQINAVTIQNTGNAPIISDAPGISSLEENIVFTNVQTETIQVRGYNLSSRMSYDQTWRKHTLPYELLGSVSLSEGDANSTVPAVWDIEAGVTIIAATDADISIGGLSSHGVLRMNGTETDPITITSRAAYYGQSTVDTNWGGIFFDVWNQAAEPDSLTHVNLLHGGHTVDAVQGVVNKYSPGQLMLDHVKISQSDGGGVSIHNGSLSANYNEITQNSGHGFYFNNAKGIVQNSVITDNSTSGMTNNSTRDYCIAAYGNYWGATNGPADTGTADTQCNDSNQTNSGNGATVSDGVIYKPWRTSSDTSAVTDRSSISAGNKFWVVANGVDSAELAITVRDSDGNPLAGKQITLNSSLGTIVQPTAVTDSNGRTTASITSTEEGEALITGENSTDGTPLEATLEIFFWSGSDDTGGLIQPSGSPYASPELVVEGEPFQVGFPVLFRLPMENSAANTRQVEVTYSVSTFGIGNTFGVVDTINQTLVPGGSNDFLSGFTPPDTTHRCVSYNVTVTEGRATDSYSFGGTRNLSKTKNPCDEPDVYKLIPRFKGNGLKATQSHFKNLRKQSLLVNNCFETQLNFRSTVRDYETLVSLSTIDPITLNDMTGLTTAQIAAAQEAAQLAADISELNIAMAITQGRINEASQAGAWNDASEQLKHYRAFQTTRIDKMRALANQIDIYILDGVDDEVYLPSDYADYLNELKTNGYDADLIAELTAAGYSTDDINYMLAREIDILENSTPSASSFEDSLRQFAADLRAEATGRSQFATAGVAVGGRGTESTINTNLINVDTMEETFVLTNPRDTTQTITLLVRPGNMPLGWTWSLDQESIELDAGESTTITLTIDPGPNPILADVDTFIAVEGYIGSVNPDNLIGGVVFQQRTPLNATTTGEIFLPFITK